VLELARIMSQYSFKHTIKFAFWNCEENGELGSIEYVKYAYSNKINVSLYVNLDSSCYDPDNRMTLDLMFNNQSSWVSDMMTEYNTLYGMNFTLDHNAHSCSSDYSSFWAHGYTAVMTHSETHGPQHTQDDTIDKVSIVYTQKNGELSMSLLAALAEVQSPTRTPSPNSTLIPSPSAPLTSSVSSSPGPTGQPTTAPTSASTSTRSPISTPSQAATSSAVCSPTIVPAITDTVLSQEELFIVPVVVLFLIVSAVLMMKKYAKNKSYD
jgi:hypothetical protein